jgi:hypothetical protein
VGYKAQVVSVSDYYSFGSEIAERSYDPVKPNYRFGFNKHERLDEVYGKGNVWNFGDYGYDARLGRRWNVEPNIKKYPWMGSYAVFGNNPVKYADWDGMDAIGIVQGNQIIIKSTIYIVGDGATKEKAAEMQKQIMGYWGKDFTYKDESGKEYKVKFDIQVRTINPGGNNPIDASTNFVRLVDESKGEFTSEVSGKGVTAGWYGRWGNDESAQIYAHETGHFLGFEDLYYTTNKKGVKIVENYKGVDENELMGKAAADGYPVKPKVTQKDIDKIAKYVLSNQKDHQTIIKARGMPVRNEKNLSEKNEK